MDKPPRCQPRTAPTVRAPKVWPVIGTGEPATGMEIWASTPVSAAPPTTSRMSRTRVRGMRSASTSGRRSWSGAGTAELVMVISGRWGPRMGPFLAERRPAILPRSATGRSQGVGGEGVAAPDRPLRKAPVEPAHPLGRGAVGERVGVHAAGGALLDPVVPDGLGRVDGALDVVLVQVGDDRVAVRVLGLLGALGPGASKAVGHQLDADRVAPGAALRPDPAEHPELVLDVVAVLVRDHVADRERAAFRAELSLQHVVEEGGVQVDLAVVGAVEGPHLGAGGTASGGRGALETDRLHGLVGPFGLLRVGPAPVVLHGVGEQVGRARLGAVGVLARLAAVLGRGVAGARRGAATGDPDAGALGQHHEQHDEDDRAQADLAATAAGDRQAHPAAARATTTARLDLALVDASLRVEAHGGGGPFARGGLVH